LIEELEEEGPKGDNPIEEHYISSKESTMAEGEGEVYNGEEQPWIGGGRGGRRPQGGSRGGQGRRGRRGDDGGYHEEEDPFGFPI